MATPSAVEPAAATRAGLGALFVAAGGLALAVQVVLLRELIVSLQGDETAIALGMAAWLAGIAVGALAARLLVRGRPEVWTTAAIALLAVAGSAGVVHARLGRWLLAPPPGELLALGNAALLAAAVLAIPGFLVGFLFTALAATAPRAGWAPGRGLARLYVLESLGSLAAGVLVTFVVVPHIGGLRGLLLAAALMLALGSAAARARVVPGSVLLPALALALAAGAISPLGRRAEEATARLRFAGLVPGVPLLAWKDTPAQQLMIAGGATRHLYAGGQYAGSFPDPAEHEAQAYLLMSLASHPRTVLLVGGGVDGTLRFMLSHPVERIDVVAADPEALAFLRAYLPPEDRRALDDPRVRLVADDPRRFLARPPHGARGPAAAYDLILVLEPAPVTLLLARLTTIEFYRLAAARLAADGALVVSLETAPNVLTGETAALAGSIAGALQAVFPIVHASPGPDTLLVAGTDATAVTLAPEALADRYRRSGATSEIFAPELFATLFPPGRVADLEAAVASAAARVPASRDNRPVSFLHALARRRSLAAGTPAASGSPDRRDSAARLVAGFGRASPAAIAAVALAPSLLLLAAIGVRRRRPRGATLAATHAVVVTGACGMGWSLLILFSYQARAGALYGRIGMLTALFMLGLAIGGLATTRAAQAPAAAAHRCLAGAAAGAFLFSLVVPAVLGGAIPGAGSATGPAADLLHGALLLAGGLVTGALFPAAAGVLLAARPGPRATAADLEAADHAGAAVAALAAGVVLVPVLGLAGTGWLLAALQGTALAGVLLAVRPPRSPGSPGDTSGSGRR